MKITRMKWSNYKGLQDGEIHADGCDVYVSGRNGSGKSSIASIIPFVLFGKRDEVRRYDDGFAMNSGLIHIAEIEFDSGLVLRRERCENVGDNGTSDQCYVNGQMLSAKSFNADVAKLMNKAGEVVLNPFAFCQLKKDDQRKMLLEHFGTLDEKSLLQMPEYAELSKELNGLTVAEFMKQRREVLKKLKSEAKEIPSRVLELRLRLKDKPADIESAIAHLNGDIKAREAKIAECRELMRKGVRTEYDRIRNQIDSLSYSIETVEREINSSESRRKELLTEYKEVYAKKLGKCPTCGQAMPTETFETWKEKRLGEIVDAGLKVKGLIKESTGRLAAKKTERSKLEDELKRLQPQLEQSLKSDDEQFAEIQRLNAEIADVKVEVSRLNEYRGVENRIAQLSKNEKELNADITRSEGLIALAEDFQRRAVESIEGQINSQFEHVNFKLFNLLAKSGELSPTCEATLHGVPYSSLSKGERLKAALDIWRTWQRVFKTELPLILDDAESYTPNSFVDLPNQKFYFLVTDGELKISVLRMKEAA